MKEQFLEIYKQNIVRPGSDKLLAWLETTDFFEAPASTRFHLSRPGGLVEHSIHVYERLLKLYISEKTEPGQPVPYFPTVEELETLPSAVCCMTSVRPTSTAWRCGTGRMSRASGRSTPSMWSTTSSPMDTARSRSISSLAS